MIRRNITYKEKSLIVPLYKATVRPHLEYCIILYRQCQAWNPHLRKYIGPGNTGVNYGMGGTILSKTVMEKGLGVTMNANMKVSEQCRIAASKGNQVLGMIRRNITYKEKI